ncbi:MAG TPA: cytidine deaminase [Microlunatus sp.]
MHLDDALVRMAQRTLEARFPESGGLAAAVYTADGGLLTSVVFDPEWGGGGLCAETGALLEAHRDQRAVTAVACVSRLSAADRLVIATPCGICQERLYHWGYGVEVAVPRDDDPARWQMRTLGELQPYHWVKSLLLSNDPATAADHRDATDSSGSG